MDKKFNPHKYTYHFNIGNNIKLGEGVASWSTLKGSDLLYIHILKSVCVALVRTATTAPKTAM